jgi:hypothetical protein
MQLFLFLLASAAFKCGYLLENIYRNRKLGNDPDSPKWHRWQAVQYAALLALVAVLHPAYLLYELPFTALFGILFNGLTNRYTFPEDRRPFWYVPPIRQAADGSPIYAGSAMDRWLQQRPHPVRSLLMLQASVLLVSLLPLLLYCLLS